MRPPFLLLLLLLLPSLLLPPALAVLISPPDGAECTRATRMSYRVEWIVGASGTPVRYKVAVDNDGTTDIYPYVGTSFHLIGKSGESNVTITAFDGSDNESNPVTVRCGEANINFATGGGPASGDGELEQAEAYPAGSPSKPTGVTCTTTTSSSVSLSWTASSPTPANSYLITLDDMTPVAAASTSKTVSSGLKPDWIYLVQVQGVNANGEGEPSNLIQCLTAPNPPSALLCTGRTLTSISNSWSFPTVLGGGQMLGYTINVVSDVNLGDSVFTETTTSLTADMTYAVSVTARNDGGASAPAIVSCSTFQAPSAGAAPVQSDADTSSISLTWTAPSTGGTAITNYDVDFSPGSIASIGSSTSHTISGLTATQKYQVRWRATNGAGTGPWSPATSMYTEPGTTTVTCGTATMTSIAASWAVSSNYAPTFNFRENPGNVLHPGITITSATVPGLSSDTQYTVNVQVVSPYGTGAWGPATMCTTDSIPDPPTMGPCSTTANSITFNWAAPASDGGDPVTNFDRGGDVSGLVSASTLSHTFTSLGPGLSKSVKVRAVTVNGNSVWAPTTMCQTPSQAPGIPAALSCGTPTTSSVTYTWTAPADNGSPISHYEFSAGGTKNAPATSYTYSNSVIPGTAYSTMIRAVNGVGPGQWSSSFSCTADGGPPDAVTSSTCGSTTQTTIVFSWSAPNINGAPVTRYQVRRNGGTQSVTSSTSFTFTGLVGNTMYNFAVQAQSIAGNSPWSSPNSCLTGPVEPGPPGTLSCGTSTTASVSFSWTTPVAEGGSAVSEYYVRLDGGTQTTAATSASHTFSGLAVNSDFALEVAAENSAGQGPWSSSVTCSTSAGGPSRPDPPVCGTSSATSQTISWLAPADNGDPITDYLVSVNGGAGTSIGSTSLEHTINSLSPGQTYTFAVAAVNTVGASSFSSVGSCTTAAAAPAQPDPITCVSSTYDSVSISWSPPNDNGDPIIHYRVKVEGSVYDTFTGTTATITGLTTSSPVSINFQATNGVGGSVFSSAVSCTPMPEIPVVPSQPVCVDDTYTSVQLSWVQPNLRGSPLVKYEWLRNGGSIQNAGTSLSATANSLATSVSYDFRVRAVNGVGTSAWSPVTACAPSPEAPVAPSAPTCDDLTYNSITVNWVAPNARGDPVSSYTLYRNGNEIFSGDSLNAVSSGLTANSPMTYAVVAINSVGESAMGAAVSCSSAPEVPATTSITFGPASAGQVPFSWAVPNSRGEPITQYAVYRDGFALTTLSSGTTTYTAIGLTYSTAYSFKVEAINDVGYGNGVSASVTTDANGPDTPTSLACTVVNEFSIDLTWSTATVDNGPNASGYDVEMFEPSSETLVNDQNVLSFGHSLLSPATQYRYRMRARNSADTSAWSAAVSCTTSNAGIGSISFFLDPVGDVLFNDELSILPVVELRDATGAPILVGPNSVATVTLTLTTSGSGALVGITSKSAVAGVASGFTGLSVDAGGTDFVISASVSGVSATSPPITIFERAVSLLFVEQPSHSRLSGLQFSQPPVVDIVDGNGARIQTGPHAGLTAQLGISTASLVGDNSVQANAGRAVWSGLTVALTDSTTSHVMTVSVATPTLALTSNPFFVHPIGTATAFVTQPVGGVLEDEAFSVMPVVKIVDAFGVIVASGDHAVLDVGLGAQSGPGDLQGTTTVACVAGVATFAGLSIDKHGNTYSLAANVPDLALAQLSSDAFVIFARLGDIGFHVQPEGNVLTGDFLSIAPAIKLLDQFGTTILTGPHSSLQVSLVKGTGLGAMSPSSGSLLASNGVAGPFTGHHFSHQGTYRLVASTTSPSMTTTSNPFAIEPRADSVEFSTLPVGNVNPLQPLLVQPVVRILDQFGQVCGFGAHSALSVELTPSFGSMSGTSSVFALAGVATFSGVGIDRGGAFTVTATIQTSGPITTTFHPVTIEGIVTRLSFCTNPIGNVLPDEIITVQPVVCLLDEYSQIVQYGSDAGRTVELAISGGDGRAVLNGVTSGVAAAGTVSFPGLSISWNGTYEIIASSPLPSAVTLATSTGVVIDIPANRPPTLSVVSGPHATNEDAPLVRFVNASDPDANRGYDTFHVVVTTYFVDGFNAPLASDPPCVRLGGTGDDLNVAAGDFSGCSTAFEFSGRVVHVNEALNDLEIVTGQDWHGSVDVDVIVDDMGNTGVGGVLSFPTTLSVSVNAVNDAPVLNGDDVADWEAAALTLVEDTILAMPDLRLSDVDSPADNALMTLTFSSVSGTVLVEFENGGVSSGFAASHAVTASLADLAAICTTVRIKGNTDVVGAHVLDVSLADNGNYGSGPDRVAAVTVPVLIAPVNDAPVWTVDGLGVNDTLVFDEHRTLVVPTTLYDVDVAESTDVLEVQLWTDGHMAIALSPPGVLGVTDDGSDGPIVIPASAATIAAAVAQLTLSSLDGYNGPETLHLVVSDLGGTGVGGALTAEVHVPVTISPIPTVFSSGIKSGHWGSRITVFGDDFGAQSDAELAVTVDDKECTEPVRVSATELVCRAPPGSGDDHVLNVVVDGIEASNPHLPIVHYAEPIDVVVGASQTTIVKTGNATVEQWVFINTTEPVERVLVSPGNARVYSLAPFVSLSQNADGLPTEYHGRLRYRPSRTEVGSSSVSVQVVFGGSWNLKTEPVSRTITIIPYKNPVIRSFTPTLPRCGGRVTIDGSFFGPLASNLTNVTIGSLPCSPATFVNPERVVCSIGESVETGLVRVETDSGSVTSLTNVTVLERPYVQSVEPSVVFAATPTRIVLSGARLGESASDLEDISLFVQTANDEDVEETLIPCTNIEHINASFAACTTPALASGMARTRVLLTTGLGCSSVLQGSPSLTLRGPTVRFVEPLSASVYDDVNMVLTGSGFLGRSEIWVGSRNCSGVVVELGGSVAKCTIPGLARDLSPEEVATFFDPAAAVVFVSDIGGRSNDDIFFAYLAEFRHPGYDEPPPVISSTDPSRGPIHGGYAVTLSGANFGTNASDLISVAIAGSECESFSYVSSDEVVCVVADVVVLGQFAAEATTVSGSVGIGPAMFELHASTPDPVACAPRVGLAEGGARVHIFGEHLGFDSRNSTVPVVTFNGLPCTDVIVEDEHISCLAPPGPVSDDPVFVVVSVGGVSNEPRDLGFRYTTTVCQPSCGRFGDCNAVCECFAGFTGPTCDVDALVVTASGDATNEDGGSVDVRIELLEDPIGSISFDISASVDGEVELSRQSVTFSSAGSESVRVTGIDDGVRDGPTDVGIVVSLAATTDPRFDATDDRVVYLVNADAKPIIDRISPSACALNGTLSTIFGFKFDNTAIVRVDGVDVDVFRIVARNGIRVGAESLDTDVDVRRISQRIRQDADDGEAEDDGESTIELFMPPGSKGYANVEIVNRGGRSAIGTRMLFYTDDCPEEGMYGIGNNCKECPEGGICPGGNRIWAESGFWSPGESSGVVYACDPPERCAGNAGNAGEGEICGVGYEGTLCGKCVDGYYDSGKICRECPESESIMMLIIGDAIVWVLIGLAAAVIELKVNVGHVVSVVLAIQLAGAVGEQIHHLLPGWILAIYEILYLFSGDIDFVKPDCSGHVDLMETMIRSYGYNILIGLPMHVILAIARLLSWVRNRKDEDFYKQRRMHYNDRHVRAFCIHGLIVYLNVVWSSLSFVYCKTYHDDKLRLVLDENIVCFEGQHVIVASVSLFVLALLGLGLPIFFFFIQRNHAEPSLLDERIQDKWDLMFEPLRRGYRYFWLTEFLAAFTIAFSSTVLEGEGMIYFFLNVTVAGMIILTVVWRQCFSNTWENFTNAGVHLSNLLAIGTAFAHGEGYIGERETLILVSFCVFVVTVVIVFTACVGFYNVVWRQTDREVKLAKPLREDDLRVDRGDMEDEMFATFALDDELKQMRRVYGPELAEESEVSEPGFLSSAMGASLWGTATMTSWMDGLGFSTGEADEGADDAIVGAEEGLAFDDPDQVDADEHALRATDSPLASVFSMLSMRPSSSSSAAAAESPRSFGNVLSDDELSCEMSSRVASLDDFALENEEEFDDDVE